MSSIIWIITASLWYENVDDVFRSEYTTTQFETKIECHEHVWENKADLVIELLEAHLQDAEGNDLKTWAFFCENRYISFEEV
jgi:hypothetical protein